MQDFNTDGFVTVLSGNKTEIEMEIFIFLLLLIDPHNQRWLSGLNAGLADVF